MSKPRKHHRPVNVKVAKRMYENGYGVEEIGKHLDVHHSSVSKALRRAGVPMRKPGTRSYPLRPKPKARYVRVPSDQPAPEVEVTYTPEPVSPEWVAKHTGRPQRKPKEPTDEARYAEAVALPAVRRKMETGSYDVPRAIPCGEDSLWAMENAEPRHNLTLEQVQNLLFHRPEPKAYPWPLRFAWWLDGWVAKLAQRFQ